MNKQNGQILGLPKFDVAIYKYVGSVSAKSVEDNDYSLQVCFIGDKNDRFVTPFIQSALKQVKTKTKYLKLEMYDDITSSPKAFRKKALVPFPTLFLDDKAYRIGTTRDETTERITPYIDDDGTPFPLKNKDDILLFISKKTGLKPEILGYETAFQPVDQEILKVSERVKESAKVGEEKLLERLGLDELFERIESSMEKVKEAKLSGDIEKKVKILVEELAERKREYQDLKTQYEVVQESSEDAKKEFEKQNITFDMYNTTNVKSIRHKKEIERKLIDLQASAKSVLTTRIAKLLEEAKEKLELEKKK